MLRQCPTGLDGAQVKLVDRYLPELRRLETAVRGRRQRMLHLRDRYEHSQQRDGGQQKLVSSLLSGLFAAGAKMTAAQAEKHLEVEMAAVDHLFERYGCRWIGGCRRVGAIKGESLVRSTGVDPHRTPDVYQSGPIAGGSRHTKSQTNAKLIMQCVLVLASS